MWRWFLFSILALGIAKPATAQQGNKGLVPDFVVGQFAGSIGLVSAGAGYQFANNHIELSWLVGYLPEKFTYTRPLITGAVKFNYIPWQIKLGEKLRLKPLQAGVMAAHTFGNEFWGLPPERYPKGYYTFSTAWHAYAQAGSALSFPIGKTRLETYYEFNASAEEIVTWIQNPDFITPRRVLSLALGVNYYF